ncbi:MAG TPA: alkaline phosphatase family protein, partial [Myxococcota bacterium]|nr:alkaline phosphatase family protein [Myxococcota bacterium]
MRQVGRRLGKSGAGRQRLGRRSGDEQRNQQRQHDGQFITPTYPHEPRALSRVVVIGLDGLEPSLALTRFAGELPVLQSLVTKARLASCEPPITVPAWACMVTGVDPGMLGLYGFHDRSAWDYRSRRLASSHALTEPPLWALANRAGLRARIIGVPPTYPAPALDGALISCFLTPDEEAIFTHPESLGPEVRRHGYVFDTPEFRVAEDAKADLKVDIERMIERRFALAREWLRKDDWDLFMMVEMGSDRAHHAFWRYLDPAHPEHIPGHALASAIRDIYRRIDQELGRALELLRPDDRLLVVSDHGACGMYGGFAINDWLAANGFLTLVPEARGRFSPELVDWSRTTAWADGGYVGRIHINQRGREPQGIVGAEAVPGVLEAIRSTPAPTALRFAAPSAIYRATHGHAPALQVEASDLHVRCLASVGHDSLLVASNDTGPDDANHGRNGVVLSN